MRWTKAFLPTLKEAPPSLQGKPDQWLARAGLLAFSKAGYVWLPMGMRMLRKLQEEVRRRLLEVGGQEVGLPILVPVNLWERFRLLESEADRGLRVELAQPERKTRYCLGGAQEPVLADLLAGWLASYRNLPLVLFQFGLQGTEGGSFSGCLAEAAIRAAVDVYSFHASAPSVHQTYQQLLQQTESLLEFLELPYWVAQKDRFGEAGGHQLVVRLFDGPQASEGTGQPEATPPKGISNRPEPADSLLPAETALPKSIARTSQEESAFWEEVAFCEECGYTAIRSSARIGGRPSNPMPGDSVLAAKPLPTDSPTQSVPQEPVRCVSTPGASTIAEVTAFLGRPADQFLKTLIYLGDGQPVAVLIRGDHQASPTKICRAFHLRRLEMADPATIEKVTGAPVGFSGPVGMKERIPIWADWDVRSAQNVVVGANQAEAHLVGVCIGRDFQPDFFADLRMALDGDPCPQCPAKLQMGRGLSVAEATSLPAETSQQLGLRFHDAQEQLQAVRIHRFQIDLARLLWAMAAVHHDPSGLIWPERAAPFDILLICIAPEEEAIRKTAEELYEAWQNAGLEVLLDDRPLRPGVKFFDADLVGIPWRAVLGPKNFEQGQLELKHRRTGQKQILPLAEAASIILQKVQAAKRPPSGPTAPG